VRTGSPEVGGETIDYRAAISEFVFLNLRLRHGFALRAFRERFGEEFDGAFAQLSSRLIEDRLLIEDDGRIFLSDRGLELADSVFAEFV
jgi:oxygen-independent coproporphyrinogen-3 oxidase